MEKEVTDKLKKFFNDRESLLKEDSEVVYFLVEARKILEHQRGNNNYKFLRFYADWALHVKKDRFFTEEVKEMLKSDHLGITSSEVSLDELEEFLLDFKKLKIDIANFLKINNLPTDLVGQEGLWENFANIYTDIISNQPIKLPIETKFLIINVSKDGPTTNIKTSVEQEN